MHDFRICPPDPKQLLYKEQNFAKSCVSLALLGAGLCDKETNTSVCVACRHMQTLQYTVLQKYPQPLNMAVDTCSTAMWNMEHCNSVDCCSVLHCNKFKLRCYVINLQKVLNNCEVEVK